MTANGKIYAVKVQNSEGTWFTAINKVWDRTPECKPGTNVYVAVYVTSTTPGAVTIKISSSKQSSYFRQANIPISPSNAAGCEGNWSMVLDDMPVSITVTDVA